MKVSKPTPAERRATARAKYDNQKVKLDKVMLGLGSSLAKYVGAMNAGFAITSIGVISQLPACRETPGILVAIFVIGMIGVLLGAVAIVGTIGVIDHLKDELDDEWRDIVRGREYWVQKPIPEREKESSFTRLQRRIEEGLPQGKSWAEIFVPDDTRAFRIIIFMSTGIQYAGFCALINVVLSLIAISNI